MSYKNGLNLMIEGLKENSIEDVVLGIEAYMKIFGGKLISFTGKNYRGENNYCFEYKDIKFKLHLREIRIRIAVRNKKVIKYEVIEF